MPEPGATPAACGFRHDEWDGPYRMPRRCTAPAGHSDGQFAYDHGPWECLPLGWRDKPAGGTTPGTSGRTETGATTATAQVEGGEPGGTAGARADELAAVADWLSSGTLGNIGASEISALLRERAGVIRARAGITPPADQDQGGQ